MTIQFNENGGDGLEVNAIDLYYGAQQVLHEVSFALARGEIGCLLGPSGCGKSSLLRAIAGFERPASGGVRVRGREVTSLSVNARKIGFVFQDSALFPNLNVEQNIVFGLRDKSKPERHRLATEWLQRVGLAQYASAMPHELSGGEQQRVALARALAPAPDLVLLDEPFASLDLQLRRSLGRVIRDVFADIETTAVFVTHDQEEAFLLADFVGLLSQGRLLQWGTAHQLFKQPACEDVAGFIGESFFIEGSLVEEGVVETTLGTIRIEPSSLKQHNRSLGDKISVLLRYHDLQLDPEGDIQVQITTVEDHGDNYFCTFVFKNGEEGSIRLQEKLRPGASVRLSLLVSTANAF